MSASCCDQTIDPHRGDEMYRRILCAVLAINVAMFGVEVAAGSSRFGVTASRCSRLSGRHGAAAFRQVRFWLRRLGRSGCCQTTSSGKQTKVEL
jgi:hypothetical protein